MPWNRAGPDHDVDKYRDDRHSWLTHGSVSLTLADRRLVVILTVINVTSSDRCSRLLQSSIGIAIPGSRIPAHLLNPESRDWRCFNPGISGLWKMQKMPEFYGIFARKISFPEFWGQFRAALKLRVSGLEPTPTTWSWRALFFWRNRAK